MARYDWMDIEDGAVAVDRVIGAKRDGDVRHRIETFGPGHIGIIFKWRCLTGRKRQPADLGTMPISIPNYCDVVR